MRRLVTATTALSLMILILGGPRSMTKVYSSSMDTTPGSAVIEFTLTEAPGLNAKESTWEITYELRLSTDAELWESRKRQRASGVVERNGEVLKNATIKKQLQAASGKSIRAEVPFSASTLEALKTEPRERIRIDASNRTPENLKLAREQEIKSKVFLLYAVVNVYDDILKRTITIPISRTWPFADYPDARFQVTIEIHKDGSYGVKSSEPKTGH